MSDDRESGIWLEVEDVRFERGSNDQNGECRVQLKGDRTEPKKVWWLVDPGAVAGGGPNKNLALEDYRAILRELDRKRLVLARLGAQLIDKKSCVLECDAFRFQASELGSR